MKFFFTLALCITYINFSSAYFFPVCVSKDVRSCISHLNIPNFSFLNDLFATTEKANEISDPDMKEPPNLVTTTILTSLETIGGAFSAMVIFWKENISPTLTHAYELTLQHLPPVDKEYLRFLKYFPWLKYEEKAKADSRLYFLFIATSLGIYLTLYIYFSRKLYFYYQASLREQYLNNVKKIFKSKD